MTEFLNMCISSLVQILLFALIPFVWWCITARKEQNFAKWIGLKKTQFNKNSMFWIIVTSLLFLLSAVLVLYYVKDIESATSIFHGLGLKAVPSILVYAIFKTSLSEEIFFRGFLLKRLSNKFGFNIANTIQATLFGLLHGIMFISLVDTFKAIIIILFTGCIAWIMGYVNEKKADGSIIPSWIMHSISNIFSGLCSAYMII